MIAFKFLRYLVFFSLIVEVYAFVYSQSVYGCYCLFSGEWMNNSAGLAFAPHVIHVGAGEVCYELLIF